MNAWLVRAGKTGERDKFNLDNNVISVGFNEVGDLSGVDNRDALREIMGAAFPVSPKFRVASHTGQLWTFTNKIEVGDLVVLPLKSTKQLAIGEVRGPYEYKSDDVDKNPHMRSVKWLRIDIARTAVKQDLLYSLGAFMTVCGLTRNDAFERIKALAKENGRDPGASVESFLDKTTNGESDSDSEVTDSTAATDIDLEQWARDRISAVMAERFAGHRLAHLVGAVLEAQGFVCDVAPEGPDGGIDIFAGRGSLGLDSPRLIVQVKSSTTSIDAPTVRELHGVISTHGADQGLLVAWGGLNKTARKELGNQHFNVRVWEASDLIDHVTATYEQLSESIRSELPLKQIWTFVEDLVDP